MRGESDEQFINNDPPLEADELVHATSEPDEDDRADSDKKVFNPPQYRYDEIAGFYYPPPYPSDEYHGGGV